MKRINLSALAMSRYFAAALACLALAPGGASAQTAVSLVSNMDGTVRVVEKGARSLDFGDELVPGEKVEIGPGSSLALTYYEGCGQETFSGNSMIEVGKTGSRVISGKVETQGAFDCEVPDVALNEQDSFKKAAFHFRGVSPVHSTNAKAEKAIQALAAAEPTKSWRVDASEQGEGDVKLKIWTAKRDNIYFDAGEEIVIYFVADKDAYLSLNYFQADGNVVHFVPNIFEDKQRIEAGKVYVIGGNKSKLKLVVEQPYGEETISAFVSTEPFPAAFHSEEAVENAEHYRQAVSASLPKNAQVAEYALGIWTRP